MRPDEAIGGLSTEEARRRRAELGPGDISPPREQALAHALLEELREPMILLLLVTGVLYGVWGRPEDTITIFVVIFILVGVEVGNERRARHAIAALRALARPTARAIRDGVATEVVVGDLVPLDAIVLEPGAVVPADARVAESHGLAVDESTLTGESTAVRKEVDRRRDLAAPAVAREAMVFAGTTVVAGRALAIVVATGSRTELGRIVALTAEARPPRTPLQLAMRELSRSLVGVALAVSVLVPVLGVLIGGQPIRSMILVGLALAFATIPEEMPIIITMVLALGGYRLSRHHAIVKRLRAVETLGAVTFIATDKTGTLTENRMRVDRVEPTDFSRRVLEAAALSCPRPASDPTDLAVLRAAEDAGIDLVRLIGESAVADERDFDQARPLRSVVVGVGGRRRMVAKGAPEAILERSTHRVSARGHRPMDEGRREAILRSANDLGARGLRVLAVAERLLAPGEREPREEGLATIGLIGLVDPPRTGVAEALSACRTAGVRVAMVTGDHPATAVAVAREVGIAGDPAVTGAEVDAMEDDALEAAVAEASVFARISPAGKLRIVRAAHRGGHVVASTGDGVNDGPALAAADVGVAMGETGTDVARETADIVLTDDDFGTIVRAIEEGRVLFANLRKGVRYYLACKLALIASMLLPAVLGIPLPFAPVQIIVMELFMDLAASATFVAERGEEDTMRRPPRDPHRPFLDRDMITNIVRSGAGLFGSVATAYLVARATAPASARTVAFVTWLLGHFLLAVNLRSDREPVLRLGLRSNRPMLVWGAATVTAAAAAVLVPALHGPLRTTSLGGAGWALALGLAFAGTSWMEVCKWIPRTRSSND